MRDIDFLPGWYPVLRRRRALVVTQAWATAVLMATICLFGVAAHHRVMAFEDNGRVIQRELVQTRSELKMLDEQLRLKKQLEQQGIVQSRVGLQVDVTRLLGELEHLMGPDMALLELAAETQETVQAPKVNNNRSTVVNKSAKPETPAIVQRKLKLKLVGIAPSDVDVANFLAGLTNKPYFDQVAMTYAKDRVQEGRMTREFQLTFLINLDMPSAE